LPLAEPFADPGVAQFGLRNAVMALGDTFIEVVAPLRAGTAAGRFLDRRGPGGYMVIFQVADLEAARGRARSLGIREVWRTELPDIAAVHLHPADVGAAIVSLDRPLPSESWRWAGPAWTGAAPAHGEGGVTGVTLSGPEPEALAQRWRRLLDGEAGVRVERGEVEEIAEFEVAVPGVAPVEFIAGGVRFRVTRSPGGPRR
jgi:Glyoxalase-like domain